MKRGATLAILLVAVGVGVGLGLRHGTSTGIETHGGSPLSLAVERVPGTVEGSVVTAGALSARGDLALGSKSGAVEVFAPSSGPPRNGVAFHWLASRVSDIAISGDGSTVAAEMGGLGETAGELLAWRVRGEASYSASVVPSSDVWALALSSDGNLLAAVIDGQVDVYSITARRELASFRIPGPISSGRPQNLALRFNRADTAIAVGAGEDVTAWALTEGRKLWSVSCHCAAENIAISSNLRYAAFGTDDAHVILWDLWHRDEAVDFTVTANPQANTDAVQIDNHGQYLVAASGGTIGVWRSPRPTTSPTTLHLTDGGEGGEIDNIEMTANGDRMLVYPFPTPSVTEQGAIGSGWLVRIR
ncbi:MAG TPA: WD40 repeat domain-containing protein [Solirubrobacteraceae bacterium]|jgi:WD40 repeat protein|nr:WD40 repeat domain-containing protein [Solirubrobacteraceae bacterium]